MRRTLILVVVATFGLSSAFGVATEENAKMEEKAKDKATARYLALMGLAGGGKSLEEDTSHIQQMLDAGPNAWFTKMTHAEIASFSKDIAALLSSKTAKEALLAVQPIEAAADKMHKEDFDPPFMAKIAVLLAAAKDIDSPAVSSALVKRAEEIKAGVMADVARNSLKDFGAAIDALHAMNYGYCRGLGLSDMRGKDDITMMLFEPTVISGVGNPQLQDNEVRVKKLIKSAELGLNVMLAADKVISEKDARKAKTAILGLNKAVKTRIAQLVAQTGASKLTDKEAALAMADGYQGYALLLKNIREKVNAPDIKDLLSKTIAEVIRYAKSHCIKALKAAKKSGEDASFCEGLLQKLDAALKEI